MSIWLCTSLIGVEVRSCTLFKKKKKLREKCGKSGGSLGLGGVKMVVAVGGAQL